MDDENQGVQNQGVQNHGVQNVGVQNVGVLNVGGQNAAGQNVALQNNTVVEIERVLAMGNLPASPPHGAGAVPVQRARGYHLGKLLRHAKEKMDPQDLGTLKAKSFIAYAKTTSSIVATVCNAINLFGCTVGYMIHDSSSARLKSHLHMRHVFIQMTLAFLPFTVLTAGLANTLEAKRSFNGLINIVAVMLYMEAIYMAAICTLFLYYLVDGSRLNVVVSCTTVVAVLLIAIPGVMYRRPGGWRCYSVQL